MSVAHEPPRTSGERRVEHARAQLEALQREQRRAAARLRDLTVRERGEGRVLATLRPLTTLGWRLLEDRQ